MKAPVIFRRIGGRVIPILTGVKPGRVIAGAAVGAMVGEAAGAGSAHNDLKSLQRNMGKDLVNTRAAVKRFGVANVTIISGESDLRKNFGWFRRLQLKGATRLAAKRKNAFAARIGGKDYLFISKRANAGVIGHELGHIKDFRRNGAPGFISSTLGRLSGSTLAAEKRAWALSPSKRRDSKDSALKTYSSAQTGSRWGAIAGAMVGSALRGRV